MVNTGKPSQDCHLCRQRRVKCDLGLPGCQRCVKYGVQCPGYRDRQELIFRNTHPAAVKRRRKRISSEEFDDPGSLPLTPDSFSVNMLTSIEGDVGSPLVSSSTSTDVVTRPNRASSMHMALPKSLNQHWTAQSVPILLNVYSPNDFICSTYRTNPQDGPLVWAAHLFSRTYVTNIRYSTGIHKVSEMETQREMGTYLGMILSSVGALLKTPQGAFRDDVLATIWILANYELLVGSMTRMIPLSPWYLHTNGLYSILKTRGSTWLRTDLGRKAFWPCYNMVQIQALITNIECPPESDEWLGILKENLYIREAFPLHVSIFISKCAHVQARILTILRGRDFHAAEREYYSLVRELIKAEQDLDEFVATSTDCIHNLYTRNLYNSALVKGYHYLQLLSNFLTHYAASKVTLDELITQRQFYLQKTQAAAQEIIHSVPWVLGSLAAGLDKSPRSLFKALTIVWPLAAVYAISTTLPEQKIEAKMALVFIGNELGLRQALDTQPGSFPIPLEAQQPLGVREDV